jgi:hypothetical protein
MPHARPESRGSIFMMKGKLNTQSGIDYSEMDRPTLNSILLAIKSSVEWQLVEATGIHTIPPRGKSRFFCISPH